MTILCIDKLCFAAINTILIDGPDHRAGLWISCHIQYQAQALWTFLFSPSFQVVGLRLSSVKQYIKIFSSLLCTLDASTLQYAVCCCSSQISVSKHYLSEKKWT